SMASNTRRGLRTRRCTNDEGGHGEAQDIYQGSAEAGGEKARRQEGREAQVEKAGEGRGQTRGSFGERPAQAVDQTIRPGRQGARGRAHSRFLACAGGPDLYAAFGLYGRRRDQ